MTRFMNKPFLSLSMILLQSFTDRRTTLRKNALCIFCLLFICLTMNACRIAEVLSTHYSENIAQANYRN